VLSPPASQTTSFERPPIHPVAPNGRRGAGRRVPQRATQRGGTRRGGGATQNNINGRAVRQSNQNDDQNGDQSEEEPDNNQQNQPASEPKLTEQQKEWIDQLDRLADDDLDGLAAISKLLTTAAAVRVTTNPPAAARPRQGSQRPFQRRPPPARPAFDGAAASNIQKQYRIDRKKAVNNILAGESPHCNIDPDIIHQHLTNVFSDSNHIYTDPPACVPDLSSESTPDQVRSLLAPISPAQVSTRLSKMASTAPGPDGARYSGLKRIDPNCHVMAAIFSKCLRTGKVPAEWKESTTVLVYKAGPRENPSNWRPLSLSNTIAKLYAAIIADRITRWAEDNGHLSPEQKGFTNHDGCLEHNFILQTAIDDARREGKELLIAWLDLCNAFPSIPHSQLIGILKTMGLPEELVSVISDLYAGSTTRAMTSAGLTEPIEINSGVRQGCPLSPEIFNLAMEAIIRSITARKGGYQLGEDRISVLAYADDLVFLAENEMELQQQLDTAAEVAEWSGLTFKPSKCATLHLCRQRGGQRVQPTEFKINDDPLLVLGDGDHYRHLGVPTGYRNRQTPNETIQQFQDDFEKIDQSLLAPWQKIDAAATFILPRMDFIMRGADVSMKPLKQLDKRIRKLAKGWLNLPQRASAEVVYILPSQGGAGLLPVSDNRYIMSVVQGYRILTSPDPLVHRVAWWSLRKVVKRKIGHQANNQDIAEYLNGISQGDGGDISSIWSRVRKSTKELKKKTKMDWWWCETTKEMQLLIPRPGMQPDLARVHPAARRLLCTLLRTAVRAFYLKELTEKPDQGKVFEVSTKWDASNHMMRSGQNTRFADWRFLHRAKLDCVPLNGARRFGEGDKRCRRCNHPNETLPHVLNCCNKHSLARLSRHNNVLNRLAKAVPTIAGAVRVDRQVPDTESTLRPDLVVINHASKQLVIIDVAITFENRYVAFEKIRQEKVRKYTAIADLFRDRGWEVNLDAVVVGSLGSWDPANERSLKLLRISPRYAKMMRKFIVSDTIRWSRDIYVEHLSGKRQFIIPELPTDPPGAILPQELYPAPNGQQDASLMLPQQQQPAVNVLVNDPAPFPTDVILPVNEIINHSTDLQVNNPANVLENAPVLPPDPTTQAENGTPTT